MKIRPKSVLQNKAAKDNLQDSEKNQFSVNNFVTELERKLNEDNPNLFNDLKEEIENLSEANSNDDLMKIYKNLLLNVLEVLCKSDSNKRVKNTLHKEFEKIALTEYRVEGFESLDNLLIEIIEDQTRGYDVFLKDLKNGLIQIKESLAKTAVEIDEIYEFTSQMMLKLEPHDIPQRKYIYKLLAERLSSISIDFKFVSPEDADFVDPVYHTVTIGAGQRIKKGLSFIVIEKDSGQVIKYGKVKAG